MTSLRERLLFTVAGQLGRPNGMLSPLVARALNKGNERVIALSARRSADHLTHAQVPSPNSTSGLVMGRYPGNFTTLMSISTLKLANL